MTEAREMSTDYPLHVHEPVEAEANVGRLLAALNAMFGIDSQIDVAFAGNPIVIEDVKRQVFDAIAKAEKRS